MEKFDLKTLHEGVSFSDAVYLDEQFILAAPERPISRSLLNSLSQWDFTGVLSDGKLIEKATVQEQKNEELESVLAMSANSESERIDRAAKLFDIFKKHMQFVFTNAMQKEELDYEGLTQYVARAVPIIREDKQYLMRSQRTPPLEGSDEYLTSHGVRSMIISIIIGNYLKFSEERLTELGVAALLHEIGMTKLPVATRGYYTKRQLTNDEKKAIFAHPVYSYNVLKSFNAPLVVCLAGLEHHERENGSGYPQKLTGDRISLYAKIIAIACSYEALTANRPHRDAKNAYAGMVELLKNEGKQYDPAIVKALLYSLSMYPVGLYILLSNGKRGQVVDIDPANPFFPIVQVFGIFTPEGGIVKMKTSKDGVYIIRPLRKDEL